MLCRLILTCVLAMVVGGIGRAEFIDGYSAARNDLYVGGTFPAGSPPTLNPTFFSPYNYSGVGWVPSAGPGTKLVTMISPIDFICAWHFLPGMGTTIAFRGSDGSYITRTVAAQTNVSSTDITVGRLSSALPGTVSFYPIAYGTTAGEFLGQEMIMVGQHAQVGRNIIGGIGLVTGAGLNDTIGAVSDFEPNAGPPNVVTDAYGYAPGPPFDEFVVTANDSGAPSFLTHGGVLSLLGHHMGQYSDPTQPTTLWGSADSLLAAYAAEIDSAMTSPYQLTTHTVPEPSALILVGLVAGVGYIRRRRAA